MSHLDRYALRARRMPVLLVVLPALLLLAVSVLRASTLGIATGAVLGALSVLAAELGRDRGRNLQPALWARWGGPPTTQLLRFCDAPSREFAARAHEEIERVFALDLPSEAREAADPKAADETYEAATLLLIGKCQ